VTLEATPVTTATVPFALLNLDARLLEGIRDLGSPKPGRFRVP
jgi:hypothetical protein